MSSSCRILCLHGRGLNGAFFKAQLGRLPKLLPPNADFHFVDGPFQTKVAPEAKCTWRVVLPKEKRVAWEFFQRKSADSDDAEIEPGLDWAWDAAVEEVRRAGPFSAVIGFSQGANVATALLARQAASSQDLGLRKAVLWCGTYWGVWPTESQQTWKAPSTGPLLPVQAPSLHIVGLQDPYLPQSRRLMDCYANTETAVRTTLEHSGKHTVYPEAPKERDALMKEVAKFLHPENH